MEKESHENEIIEALKLPMRRKTSSWFIIICPLALILRHSTSFQPHLRELKIKLYFLFRQKGKLLAAVDTAQK